jgi:hypothetical protein
MFELSNKKRIARYIYMCTIFPHWFMTGSLYTCNCYQNIWSQYGHLGMKCEFIGVHVDRDTYTFSKAGPEGWHVKKWNKNHLYKTPRIKKKHCWMNTQNYLRLSQNEKNIFRCTRKVTTVSCTYTWTILTL